MIESALSKILKVRDPLLPNRLARIYRGVAFILLNTVILLVLANLGALLILWATDRIGPSSIIKKYGGTLVEQVYPEYRPEELRQLLHETWERPLELEPFTQLKEREFQGDYVNVDAVGFRHIKDQAAWPPRPEDTTVFVFGGSTTFGYGVSDDETIASYLQEILKTEGDRRICIYNFGRADYYSTPERVLFAEILSAGIIPDIAVFIDGLNEFGMTSGWPDYSEEKEEYLGELQGVGFGQTDNSIQAFVSAVKSETALGRLITIAIRRWEYRSEDVAAKSRDGSQAVSRRVTRAIDRYRANQRLIQALASDSGVSCLFVWQPVPTYNFDLKYHPFARWGFGGISHSREGYEQMAIMDERSAPNFLWGADMLQDVREPVFIDLVHYSDVLNRRLAESIAVRFEELGWPLEPSNAN